MPGRARSRGKDEATPAALSSAALASVARLIGRHSGLPPIDHVNFRFSSAPPQADLWVNAPEHVEPWARALHTHADEVTTIEDHPQPSHVITSTPRVVVDGVSIEVVHLRYLTDARPS